MTSIYNSGTVSVANGNAVVTGTGTAWAVSLVTGGMFSCAGLAIPIASVASDTSLTLAYPWPGTTASGAGYAIDRGNSDAAAIVDVYDRLTQVLRTLSLAGVHPNESGSIADRDALVLGTDDEGFLFLHAEPGVAFVFYRWTGTAWDGPFDQRGPSGVGSGGLGLPAPGAANKFPYYTGANTVVLGDITVAGRALLDDANAAAQLATLGFSTYMAGLASTANVGAFRTALALVIGNNVQAWDADLDSWAAVARASGYDTFSATPSSANLRALLTDETGTGAAVFATSPTLVTPNIGAATGAGLSLSSSTQFQPTVTVEATYNGAAGGYFLAKKSRAGAAVQVSDSLGTFIGQGLSTNLTVYNAASVSMDVTAVATATVSGRIAFSTDQGGTGLTSRLTIQSGVQVGAPTGGDKGVGSLNASDVYNDNVALTCMALAKEFAQSKDIDLDKWDAMVPDLVVPERVESVPVMVEVPVTRLVDERNRKGILVRRAVSKVEKVQAVELDPVWDAKGNGIDVLEIPVFEEVVRPKEIVRRVHGTARVFKAMVDDGFDPRDPDQYFAKLVADEALPGMPTKADWVHNSLGTGEMFSRKWLAMEMLAIVSHVMWSRIKDLSERVATLEADMPIPSGGRP